MISFLIILISMYICLCYMSISICSNLKVVLILRYGNLQCNNALCCYNHNAMCFNVVNDAFQHHLCSWNIFIPSAILCYVIYCSRVFQTISSLLVSSLCSPHNPNQWYESNMLLLFLNACPQRDSNINSWVSNQSIFSKKHS